MIWYPCFTSINRRVVDDEHSKVQLFNNYFGSVLLRKITAPPRYGLPRYWFYQDIYWRSIITLENLDPCKLVAQIVSIIKETAADLRSSILTLLYQASVNQGMVPIEWKKLFVYKKGGKSLVWNYRPISLTSVPCKTLEHTSIILSHIYNHLNKHIILCILCQEQHGFRSCETQFAMTVND